MFKKDFAFRGFPRRGLRLSVGFGVLLMVSASLAQNIPARQSNPPTPFQEKAPSAYRGEGGVTTPRSQTLGIESKARKRHEQFNGAPLERNSFAAFIDADDVAEFSALGRYSVVVLTVVTQKSEELFLKRLYVRTLEQEIPLLKLSTRRIDVDQGLLTYGMFGPYREDGLYLL